MNGFFHPAAYAVAQATSGPATSSNSLMGPLGSLLPWILIMVVLWFVFLQPKRKQEKKKEAMLGGLKRGDRVQTIGGILGTVVEVRDDNEVILKVDETANVKIRFSRSAIHRVVEEESASS